MPLSSRTRALMEEVRQSDGELRVLLLAALCDVTEHAKADEAVVLAQFLLDLLAADEEAAKGVALSSLQELTRRWRDHPAFSDIIANLENEIALCIIATKNPKLVDRASRALDDLKRDSGCMGLRTLGRAMRPFRRAAVFAG